MTHLTSAVGSEHRGAPNWYQQFFAWAMAKGSVGYEVAMGDRKRSLFKPVNVAETVLEIGPGTGPNLAYYPQPVRWIGIEPNSFMHPYLQAEADRLGIELDLRTGTAERLDTADNSIDTVVSTLVLCSVPDLSATLQEILRVLQPGGRFLFIEHVAAPEGTLLRQVQRGIRPLWQILGDGCRPDRDTGAAIAQAGFSQVEYEQFKAPIPIPLVQPHILGVAIK